MPDEQGKLTHDEKQAIYNWVKTKATADFACPMCKTANWQLAQHLASVLPLVGNVVLSVGETTYPYIQLFCTNCGSTHLINAVIAGVIPPDVRPEALASNAKEASNEQR